MLWPNFFFIVFLKSVKNTKISGKNDVLGKFEIIIKMYNLKITDMFEQKVPEYCVSIDFEQKCPTEW